MNNFRECRRVSWWSILSTGLFVALAAITSMLFGRAVASASPMISPLSILPGNPPEGRMSLSIEGENYECQGPVSPGQISTLECGEQGQAQAEFKPYNENKNGALAVYQSGKQSGSLFLMQRQGQTFAPLGSSAISIPGFGSLKVFETYILNPMKQDLSEDEVFQTLPGFIRSIGIEVNISTLRDRVANKDYKNFSEKKETSKQRLAPSVEAETLPAPAPAPATQVAEEPKQILIPTPTPRPERAEQNIEEVKPKKAKPKKSPFLLKRPKASKPKAKKDTRKIRIQRGPYQHEEVEVPRSESSFFAAPRKVLRNPNGYDLRNLSLEEIKNLERQGLIYRD